MHTVWSKYIQVDDTKEAGICQYCGTAFITEKVISNYNIVNNTTIQNATINVTKNLDEIKLETIYVSREYDDLGKTIEVLVDDKVYATINRGDVIELKIEKNFHHRIQLTLGDEKSNVLFFEKGEIINIKVTTHVKKIDKLLNLIFYGVKIEKTNKDFNSLKIENNYLRRQKEEDEVKKKFYKKVTIITIAIIVFLIIVIASST